ISHAGATPLDGWIPLAVSAAAVAIMDPMSERTGLAQLRTGTEGRAEVYLQLEPGASLMLRAFDRPVTGAPWPYLRPVGPPVELRGDWSVTFVAGGPGVPAAGPRQRPVDRGTEPLGEPHPRLGCAARAVEGVRGHQLRRHRLQTVRRVRLAARALRPVGSGAPRAACVPRPMNILAVFLLLAGQGPRNLLTGGLSAQALAAALTPPAQWHPFPTIQDRAAWEAVPQESR